ncbi:MAG TPA: hypothetical protein VKA67_07725, partial [Verrucomicrobiae bacterium]|nr:hypothetical protein [Verrucomicrobiae bacterium]
EAGEPDQFAGLVIALQKASKTSLPFAFKGMGLLLESKLGPAANFDKSEIAGLTELWSPVVGEFADKLPEIVKTPAGMALVGTVLILSGKAMAVAAESGALAAMQEGGESGSDTVPEEA